MSHGSLDPKIRFLGQKVCSVARVQTDTQTHRQPDTKVNTEDTLSGFQEFFLRFIIKDRSNEWSVKCVKKNIWKSETCANKQTETTCILLLHFLLMHPVFLFLLSKINSFQYSFKHTKNSWKKLIGCRPGGRGGDCSNVWWTGRSVSFSQVFVLVQCRSRCRRRWWQGGRGDHFIHNLNCWGDRVVKTYNTCQTK